MQNELLNFEFSIVKEEYGKFDNYVRAWFRFYMKIYNKSAINRQISISNATYIAKNREQLVQSMFERRLAPEKGTVYANSFITVGLMWEYELLKETNSGDVIISKIFIEEERKDVTIEFIREDTFWRVLNIETKDDITKTLSKKIERLEAFEEQCKVYFENISLQVESYSHTSNSSITISGELYSSLGLKLESDTYLKCVVYGNDNAIIKEETLTAKASGFNSFDIFRFIISLDAKVIRKIRIYPRKNR